MLKYRLTTWFFFIAASLFSLTAWSRVHVTSYISLTDASVVLQMKLIGAPSCKHGYITKSAQQGREITLYAANDDNSWAGSECHVEIGVYAANQIVGRCFYKWDDPYVGHTSIAAIGLPHPFNRVGDIVCSAKLQQGGNDSIIQVDVKFERFKQ